MSAPQPRADGLRLLRVVVFGNSLAIVAVVVLLVVGLGMIQSSRADSIRRSCVEQNVQHDETIRTLDEQIAERKRTASPEIARRLDESRAFTLLLIQALAPRQDCGRRVDQLTR